MISLKLLQWSGMQPFERLSAYCQHVGLVSSPMKLSHTSATFLSQIVYCAVIMFTLTYLSLASVSADIDASPASWMISVSSFHLSLSRAIKHMPSRWSIMQLGPNFRPKLGPSWDPIMQLSCNWVCIVLKDVILFDIQWWKFQFGYMADQVL